MIEVGDLIFRYKKDDVLKNVSAVFKEGHVVSILGRNGSGKSTLLKNITKILKPHSGTIYINGSDIKDIKEKDLAKDIGFLSQRTSGIDATVRDAVMTGRKPHINLSITAADIDVVTRVLKLLKLDHLACRQTTEISGGELQKVVIARALVQEPKVLLLDEPVNHLDVVNQMEVLGMIRDVTKDQNLTTVIVMHDINTALRFSDSLVCLKHGRICGVCDVDEITPDLINETYDMKVDIINNQGRSFIVPL